jgi:hypothetical protein
MLPAMLVLVLIYRIELRTTTTLAFYFSRGSCDDDFVVGSRSLIWSLCSQNGLWPGLRRSGLAVFGLMIWMEFSVTIVFLGAACMQKTW